MTQFSRYLRSRERDGWFVIFHELQPDPVYCRADRWRAFKEGVCDDALLRKLAERKLVVSSEADDDAIWREAAARLERKLNQPLILYLMLAQGCNFTCTYCPVPGMAMRYGENLLSREDAVRGLELWCEHLRDAADPMAQNHIIFYGGEPLLNKPVFLGALEEMRRLRQSGRLPASTEAMIVTNGTLFDDETIAACVRHNVLTVVGLDGDRIENDRARRYAGGRGSFDAIVASIQRLQSAGLRVAVSAIANPGNVNELSELGRFYRALGVEQFGINFLRGHAVIELLPVGGHAAFEARCVEGVIASARSTGEAGFEFQMGKKVAAFRDRDPHPHDCTCYGNQLVIRPDGQISNCPFHPANLGAVREVGLDFRISQAPIVAQWRQRSPLLHPAHRDDDSKALSGLGCAWGGNDLSGNFLSADRVLTTFSQAVFEQLIWSEFGEPNHVD
ncbi:radical SAM protein [Candidatus Uhrbacteria bacterium]|nr:radical SAM protein [Candidatus Uhrbacteria bacterium]